MKNFIIKRLLFLIPMLIIVSLCAFGLVNISSRKQAVTVLLAQGMPQVAITDELVEETNHKYGFDRPFFERYFEWLGKILRFDFGDSYVTGKSVSASIAKAFGYTLSLALCTTFVTIIFSLLFGVLCAIFENSLYDRISRGILFIISAMPSYWVGILCVWFFSVNLSWLPTSGTGSFAHFILPTFVMSIGYFCFYFRMIRNSMLENMNENYVWYMRSCGVSEKKITRHILVNSLQTVITAFSMAIPGMIAGTVVIENVFAWPGIGRLCVEAIFNKDIPIIEAYIMLIAIFYCVFNVLADIINAAVNPRLRKV